MKNIDHLRDHGEFNKVFAFGDRLEGKFLRCVYLLGSGEPALKMGVTVPSKACNAVVRNKLKRLMRVACMKQSGFIRAALRNANQKVVMVVSFKSSQSAEARRVRLSSIEDDIGLFCRAIARRL